MVEPESRIAKVSVVMPAFNAGQTIERALVSIARQTVRPLEVIVVDDGSTDDTLAAAQRCRALMNGVRLRLFQQTHSGPGMARNRAILAAQGELLAFLDSDDEWLPRKIERSIEEMKQSGCPMVAHNIIQISLDGERPVDCVTRWRKDPGDPLRTLYLRGYISSSTVVVQRALVTAVGGFNPHLASSQDYDLWLAILARSGGRFHMFDEALLRYYLFEGGITSRVEERRRCNLAIMRAHIRALSETPGPVATLVAMRAALVQVEAARNYWKRSRLGAALWSLLLAAPMALGAIVAVPFTRRKQRAFLDNLDPGREIAA